MRRQVKPGKRDFFLSVQLGGLGSSLVKSKTLVTFSFTFDLRLGTALLLKSKLVNRAYFSFAVLII